MPKKSPKKTRRLGMQKPPVPREKKAPSKYMQEIARMNFVEFVLRVDKHQKAGRMEALRLVRRNLASKFMTVYRAFRAKKYGEDFDRAAPYVWPKDRKARDPLLGELEDLDDFMDRAIEYSSPMKTRSAAINNKLQELESFLDAKLKPEGEKLAAVAEDSDDVLDDSEKKKQKVEAFLRRVIHRNRFVKKRAAAPLIQRLLRGFAAYRKVRTERRRQIEDAKLDGVKQRIKLARASERQQMDEAADKIATLMPRIHRAKEGRVIREQLKGLPYVCRAGFMKMRVLKQKASLLKTEASAIFKF